MQSLQVKSFLGSFFFHIFFSFELNHMPVRHGLPA